MLRYTEIDTLVKNTRLPLLEILWIGRESQRMELGNILEKHVDGKVAQKVFW